MKHRHLSLLIAIMIATTGCEDEDHRVARFAQESTAQQAKQNQAVTELNREAAENHRRVVEAVEESRQDILALEEDLQVQRDRIDDERRSLANERQRESLLGPVLGSLGMLLVAALPLVLCWYLLHGLRSQSDDAASEVLISDIVASHPLLGTHEGRQTLAHENQRQSTEPPEVPF